MIGASRSRPARTPITLPIASTWTSSPRAFIQPTTRSRPALSSSLSARRAQPPPSIAPICASSCSLCSRFCPSITLSIGFRNETKSLDGERRLRKNSRRVDPDCLVSAYNGRHLREPMRRLLVLLLASLIAGPAFAQSSVVQTDNVRAELVSEASVVKPGEPFWVGLRETIRPRWHTYWKNPGDSGLPTEINWTLPAGVKAEAIVWPTPHLIDVSGVINYGFTGDILLMAKITPPAD